MVRTIGNQKRRSRRQEVIIDCDIHNGLPSNEALTPYLSQRWRRALDWYGLYHPTRGAFYPSLIDDASRADSWPPSGNPPGSDLDFLRQQLLETWDIKFGVLNCHELDSLQPNLEYAAALARAANDWQVVEWLDPEPRLRASIIVPHEDGALAAAEIERRSDDPRFVQVLLPAQTAEPLGRRKYWKIYETAMTYDLPVGIHPGGLGSTPSTGAGWPSFYLAWHSGLPQIFQAQVISMVVEGVFEHFPTLKFVLIEGGYSWLPSLMWRLDHSWHLLRDEVPHLKRPPSYYIRKHFWFTTQPMEEPPEPAYFGQLLEQLEMDDRMLFATDYPHWDFDAPDQALPGTLPSGLRPKIMADNARTLYRF